MSRKTIFFRMIVTTIALVGIVVMQFYWINNAIELKREQFGAGVILLLKSLSNQLLHQYQRQYANVEAEVSGCVGDHLDIMETVSPKDLDSLIKQEFQALRMARSFRYGIYREADEAFIMGDYHGYIPELLESEYKISLGCLCMKESYHLAVHFPEMKKLFFRQIFVWMILTAGFLIILIVGYSITIYSFLTSKKVSEMKADFMNNMTHEFKTPISTISLASEMLNKPEVYNDPVKTQKYSTIIFDENNRLQTLVDRVLQMAIIDRRDFRLKMKEVDVHQIIQSVAQSYSIIVRKRNGFILTKPEAINPYILADRMHFTNIISNIIDNANKYSIDAPQIMIKTWNSNDGIYISFSDKGIGISKENQRNVFRNFFRGSIGDVHDVKGFGMGLHYVKRMVDLHDGNIHLKSELGSGSTFTLFFPSCIRENENIILNE